MFGWLKSLFGSEPAKELDVIVPPPLPKVKTVSKKADSSSTKRAAKKADSKSKTATASKKKNESDLKAADTESVITPIVETTPKRKGGRPKKSS